MAGNRKAKFEGFTQIAEHLSVGVAIVDMDGLVVYANEADCRFLGYRKEELQNMHFSAFTHPDDLAIDAHLFQELLHGKRQSYVIDKRYIKKDGSVVWGHLGVSLLPDEEDTPRFTVVSCEDLTERKLIEENLREREDKFHSIFKEVSDGIMIADAQTKRLLEANKAMCKMLGYAREELIGLRVNDIHPQEALSAIKGLFEKQRLGEISLATEVPMLRKDGSVFYADINSTSMTWGDKQCLIGIFRDITERKQIEEALRAENTKQRKVFDRAPVSIWEEDFSAVGDWLAALRKRGIEDLDAFLQAEPEALAHALSLVRLEDVNDTTLRMFEVGSKDELLDLWSTFFTDETFHIFAEELRAIWEGRNEVDFECSAQTARGRQINYLMHWTAPIEDGRLNLRRVIVALVDITERKKTERAFRNLFNNTAIAMFRTRVDGSEILDVNDKFLELVGRTHDEVIGKPSVVHWTDPRQREEMVDILKARGRVVDFPFQMLNKHGEARDCLTSLYLYPEEGILDGSVLDITERKRAEAEKDRLQAQLSQSQKLEALGTLAGGIAHDFNNILFALLGNAELARDEVPEGSPAREYIDRTFKAGNRAKELVQQILLFSRKGMADKLPLQPAAIIKEVLELVRASFPSSIKISEEIDPDSGVILANPTQVHQVLMNLCTNALHAMQEEKGELKVQLSRVELKDADLVGLQHGSEGTFVKLTITDSGCGMDKATLERIFDPYFTTKKTGKGSGIGLAVVHGIVHDCGGFTRVESDPGQGTTFDIYLPAIAEETLAPEEKPETLPGGDERILIVDDEESIASLYQETFQRLGYQAAAFQSSLETLAAFQAAPDNFDLIITDQTMPGLAGAELAAKILKIRPDIPVILCTGFSSSISSEKAIEIGVQRLIMKPASRRDLAVTVREVLDKRRSQN